MSERLSLAIFASGGGSTAEILFDRAAVVITNNKKAGVRERVVKYNNEHPDQTPLDCLWIPKPYALDRDEDGEIVWSEEEISHQYGYLLMGHLDKYNFDYLSLNGWSVKLDPVMINEYPKKIINSHPAPLRYGRKGFGGRGMHGRAIHAAVLYFARNIKRPFNTEVTLHHVSKEYDQGREVAFCEMDIDKKKDTPEILQDRVKISERKLLEDFWNQADRDGVKCSKPRSRLIMGSEIQIWKRSLRYGIEMYPKG